MEKSSDIIDEFYDEQDEQDARRFARTAARRTTIINEINYDSRRRSLWAIAALGALGYLAVVSAFFVAFREFWDNMPLAARAGVLLALMAGTYVVAWFAQRLQNPPLSKLFCAFGIAIYGATLSCVSIFAPQSLASGDDWIRLACDAFPAIAGLWAVGAFALAWAMKSRTLHYCAALILLFWLVVRSNGLDAPVAVVFCALGEYWAWNRKSASVASIYAALCLWVVLAESSLWTRSESLLLISLAVSVLLYWFGACFEIVFCRGGALVVATLALAFSSFPQFWSFVTKEETVVKCGAFWTVHLPAVVSAIAFVIFCVNMTLVGAKHCSVRFAFGIASVVVWTCAHVVAATRSFGAFGAIGVLIVAAVCCFATIWLERYFRAKYGLNDRETSNALDAEDETSNEDERRVVGSETLKDEPEFDDMLDAERREALKNGHVFALSIAYRRLLSRLSDALCQPAIVAAVALQFAFVFANLIGRFR